MVRPKQITPDAVTRLVEGIPAVVPSLLWAMLEGDGDFAPLWLFEHLRRLGYGRLPSGAWWTSNIPVESAARLEAFTRQLDEAYPDD